MKPGQFSIIFGGILLSLAFVITAGAYTQTEAFKKTIYYPALSSLIDGEQLAADQAIVAEFSDEYIKHCLAGGLTASFCECTVTNITNDKPALAALLEKHAVLTDEDITRLVGRHEEACIHLLPPKTTLLRSTE